jgi:hypothetical protein
MQLLTYFYHKYRIDATIVNQKWATGGDSRSDAEEAPDVEFPFRWRQSPKPSGALVGPDAEARLPLSRTMALFSLSPSGNPADMPKVV